jgi:hypothetical protein
MGTIVAKTRKDGSKAFAAQIVIKKGGTTFMARRKRLIASRPPIPGSSIQAGLSKKTTRRSRR